MRGRLGPVGGGQRQQRGQHRGEEAGAPHGVTASPHMVTSNCGVSSCWSQCAGLHGARVAAQLTGDGGSV